MTVTVGVRHRTGVVLAADTYVTYFNGAQRELRDVKTAKFGETVAIAGSGSGRVKQVLEFALQNIDGPRLDEDELKWAVLRFVDAARDALREAGALEISESTAIERLPESDFLLAVRDRLFTLEDDFDVLETTVPWAASGSGWEVAAGHLHALGWSTSDDIDEKRAEVAAIEAVKTAIKLNAYVDGRITTERTVRVTDAELELLEKYAPKRAKRNGS